MSFGCSVQAAAKTNPEGSKLATGYADTLNYYTFKTLVQDWDSELRSHNRKVLSWLVEIKVSSRGHIIKLVILNIRFITYLYALEIA